MSGHTPGPWRIGYSDESEAEALEYDPITVTNGDQSIVEVEAHIYLDLQEASVTHANARLVAASPELLGALDRLVARYVTLAGSGDCGHWDPETEDEVIAARAAIAKATGGEG